MNQIPSLSHSRYWKKFLKNESLWELFSMMKRGIEKESLRVDSKGQLALTPHHAKLGMALTHPYLTTDYSESLMELVTPAVDSYHKLHEFLVATHTWIYSVLDEHKEFIWPASMPCRFSHNQIIPIARYGTSLSAQLKELYRLGLTTRYGAQMQSIAGIHYNVSFPMKLWNLLLLEHEELKSDFPTQEFINQSYFHIIRNFHRYNFFLSYFLSSSPVYDPSFAPAAQKKYDFATSLRLGPMGYQNNTKGNFRVPLNNIQEYVQQLCLAINTNNPEFEKLGLYDANGKRQQISTNHIQIENEYYASIRPKRVTNRGERPAIALKERGVEYIEVRMLDVNPFKKVGIDINDMKFVDLMLIYCLIQDSPELHPQEELEISQRNTLVYLEGRNPHCEIPFNGKNIPLKDALQFILKDLTTLATILNLKFIEEMQLEELIKHPNLTPSGNLAHQLQKWNIDFPEWSLDKAKRHREDFLLFSQSSYYKEHYKNKFEDLVPWSKKKQRELEHQDSSTGPNFETFLQEYLTQGKCLEAMPICSKTHRDWQ